MRTILLTGLLMALSAGAQTARSVDDLVSFVKTAIAQKYKDGDVAAAVRNIRLANRLDEATVTGLQRLGAGPKTVAALHRLAESTASLPAAAPPAAKTEPAPPPPSPGELKRIIDEVRDNSLNYTRNLPNYVCTQVTKKHVNSGGGWTDAGTILEQLTFFEQKEKYKVVMVNNDMVTTRDLRHDQLGGATSSGEFGSILHAIFAPESGTGFAWQRWSGLNRRWVYVLRFQTTEPVYTITDQDTNRSVHTPAHGLIFADRDTRMVMRLHMECDGIPADFPIRSVSVDQDYNFADIAGHEYLLPLHSDVRSNEGGSRAWNEVSYRSYHKYGTESSISFDTGDQPNDKLKEEQPKK